ncbi:hypothetical protein HQN87_08285 [Paenibacillus tritici]|uniref:Uncharacterized protein n=1 Tax=Paenibacillus tritici TaxID=1873425 RepID=A0ABX2DL08_9BACL|nr:hypothetical protein [Paenibacillus tritici]NQX45328.1 hypothetical protein [Paenibacillus tritici]
MGKDRSRTSIPSRDIEYKSYGSGTVREYKLSPEQLEEVRQKYPATKQDKQFVKPIVQNTPVKGEKRMGKFMMTEAEFKAARADGKTIAQIAQEQDVAEATIYKHMSKWAETPKETQLLREKEALPPQVPVGLPEMYKRAQQEIEELKAALSVTQPISHDMIKSYKAEAEHWKAQATEAVALAGKAAEESAAKIERMKANLRAGTDARNAAEDELVKVTDECNSLRDRLEQSGWYREAAERDIERLTSENGQLQEELNRMITERDDLMAENDRLSDLLRTANRTVPEPASEVHLLDRSIADLTRARWILDRLSASGE